MGFPKNSAFTPEPVRRDPHVADRSDFERRMNPFPTDRTFVPIDRLEDWVYRLDELANRFDVPDAHVVAGRAANAVSEEIARVRDELATYLRG